MGVDGSEIKVHRLSVFQVNNVFVSRWRFSSLWGVKTGSWKLERRFRGVPFLLSVSYRSSGGNKSPLLLELGLCPGPASPTSLG